MNKQQESLDPLAKEIVFDVYYGDVSKPTKRYLKKLKKKMLRSNREQIAIYEKLIDEAEFYYMKEWNGEAVSYPEPKERAKTLVANLPVLKLTTQIKRNKEIILWIITGFFVLKSIYSLIMDTAFTLSLADVLGMILITLQSFIGKGGNMYFRVSIPIILIIIIFIRDFAFSIKLFTFPTSIGFVFASVFLLITLFFREK